MPQYIVLANANVVLPGRTATRLSAGDIIDSDGYDITAIQAAGIPLLRYSETTLGVLRRVPDVVEQVLAGQYWDDLPGPIETASQGASQLEREAYRDTAGLYWFARHDRDASWNIVYQFRHGWTLTPVHPHIHAIPMGGVAGVAKLTLSYAWTKGGQELPAAASWTTLTTLASITAASQYQESYISFGAITPPTWADASSNLHCIYSRLGTDAADTYTASKDHGTAAANLGLLYVDCHYQRSLLGSLTEYPEA